MLHEGRVRLGLLRRILEVYCLEDISTYRTLFGGVPRGGGGGGLR